MANSFRAAAGKVKITPEETIGLSGFDPLVNVAHPPDDILDDLFARILILDDGNQRIVLVSVDCVMTNEDVVRVCDPGGRLGAYREFRDMFVSGTRRSWSEAAQVNENNVVVCATHTHSAPEHFSDKYTARIQEKIRELVSELVPVKINLCIGKSAISAFRRPTLYPVPEVPIDQTLYTVLLETENQKCIAGLVNYAVHPTILHPSEVQLADRVSADCVGMAMNEFEDYMGHGFVSLFTQGFSGDIAPVLPGIGSLSDSYPNVKEAGHELFLDIIQSMANKTRVEMGDLQVVQETLNLPTRAGFFEPFRESTISAIALGELAMMFVPGEVFNGYVAKLQHISPFHWTIPVSLSNGYVGYLPTEEAFQDAQGGYEMTTTPFDECIDEHLTFTFTSLLRSLWRSRPAH